MYRALAPGGRFVAQCGGKGNLRTLFERADVLMATPAFAAHFAGVAGSRREFADVPTTMMRLERAGFRSIDVSMEPAPRAFPDRQAYAEFVAADLPPPAPRAAARGRTAARSSSAIARDGGSDPEPFTLDYWRLNIAARKPAAAEQAA